MTLHLRRAAAGIGLLALGASPVFAQQPAPGAAMPVVPPTKAVPKKPAVKLPANVVARVGGQDITRDQALAMFNTVGGRPIVDQLAQAAAVEQEAKRQGVAVTNAEVNARVKQTQDRIVQQSFQMGQPMTFKEIADREGFNDDLIRWSVRQDLLRQKTFAKYLDKKGLIGNRNTQVKLAHILIATMPLPGPDGKVAANDDPAKREADAKTKVDQLYADIKAKKITWEEAAKQSDDKSNADKGGELDFYKASDLDAEFAKAGWAIEKPGDIVGPIKSRFGWHIIKLLQKGKDLPQADKNKYRNDEIARLSGNGDEMNAWLRGLMTSSNVIMNRSVQIVPGAKLQTPIATPAPAAKRPPVRKAASLR